MSQDCPVRLYADGGVYKSCRDDFNLFMELVCPPSTGSVTK